VVTLPKTIDNDIALTDRSFGFDTALQIATEAIDRLHSTATSHERIIVVEVMGHRAGWLALEAGIAGGADVILLPEIPYDVEKSPQHPPPHAKRQALQHRGGGGGGDVGGEATAGGCPGQGARQGGFKKGARRSQGETQQVP
jgi:6-phosphofructokinase